MKTFCFEFYPGEVYRQIRFFSGPQKAAYLEVITAHIENPRFTKNLLDKITMDLSDEEKVEFLKIFDQDNAGFFISWIYAAIEKRSNYIASRSKNKTGKTKNIKKSYEKDMVDVYVDVKEDIKKEESAENKKPGRRPGSINEVTQYFKELGLNGKSETEAAEFVDWYTNTNWTQGKAKTPIKDWTAAARRWARGKSPAPQSEPQTQRVIYPK